MDESIARQFLTDAAQGCSTYKKLAEGAFEQTTDADFFRALDPEGNSIAAIAKHIGGNLRSRWTDFLTTDGEKPDRNRDSEFVTDADTRESIMEIWAAGWQTLFDALNSLAPEDFEQIVKIRGEDYTVVKAVNRAMLHTASHVGQIVLLGKHFRSAEWQTLSVPRNRSEEFNSFMKAETAKDATPRNSSQTWQKFAAETDKSK